ncbi:MAG: hypothetical protein Fur0021_23980 [Candidatus Promineifilaceae bacterium]
MEGEKLTPISRESTWHVARRCLAMLLRLQQGPASRQALIAAVKEQAGEDAYGDVAGEKLQKRFEQDKRRLWDHLHVKIKYSRQRQGYELTNWERPLLNLPDTELETLALLADTFQPESPHAESVQRLVERLVGWLPASRQRAYHKMRGLQPELDLRLRDSEPIAADVWQQVLEGYNARQIISFDYVSPYREDPTPRQHHVEPWDFYFSERGHWRLRGYCRFNDGPAGPWEPHDYITYRLNFIQSGTVRILPQKLPGTRPLGKPKPVIYRLSPTLVRSGVGLRREFIAPPTLTPLENGWVRVTGKTYDIFDLARNLLYYGDKCVVEGGSDLLREVQTLVAGLENVYRS